MASNSFWGFSTWGSGDFGGLGQDLTIQVGGTTNNTWDAGSWGTGYWNAITPDPGLQSSTQTGIVTTAGLANVNATGSELSLQVGTVTVYIYNPVTVSVTGSQISTQTGTVTTTDQANINVN